MEEVQFEKQELKDKSLFEKMYSINVNEFVENKNGLNYLSWAYAWAVTKKLYPNANYKIIKFGENNLPYVYDENTGYMVFTEITIDEQTHQMWLPVLDSFNKAMKNKPYTYNTKNKKGIVVEAANMFDINKTIMRCLVKNLAMFGLGLYIYAGEDLPVDINKEYVKNGTLEILVSELDKFGEKRVKIEKGILNTYHSNKLSSLTEDSAKKAIDKLKDYHNKNLSAI